MKKLNKLLFSMLLVLVLILPSVQVHANTEYSVKVGSKLKLKSSMKKVKWGSSDTATATVTKKGVVKGISEGTCIIAAVGSGKTELFTVIVKNEEQAAKDDDILINTGLDAVKRMKEYTASDIYRKFVLSSETWMETMVEIIEKEDVTEPKAIYEVETDYQLFLSYLAGESSMSETIEDISNAPDSVKAKLEKSVFNSMPSMINAKQGSQALAFTSTFSESGNILYETFTGRRSFIYIFESGYPAWVTFMSGDDGIVSYTAQWLYMKDDKDISSDEEIIKSLYLMKMPFVTVNRVK